jgi:hypothetical protein
MIEPKKKNEGGEEVKLLCWGREAAGDLSHRPHPSLPATQFLVPIKQEPIPPSLLKDPLDC